MARRRWLPQPIENVPDGLVLFDGVCVLCSGWVRFIIEHDAAGVFRFASIQGRAGAVLAERLGIDTNSPETNAVVVNGRAYFKSDAAIVIFARLPGYAWVRCLAAIPRPIRNRFYDMVARSRYRIFGRTDACMMPTPELTHRFIGDEMPSR